MNDLLTTQDMEQLTGYKKPEKQCEILTGSGVRFIRRADGRPTVTWTVINNSLSPIAANQEHTGDGFNLGALE